MNKMRKATVCILLSIVLLWGASAQAQRVIGGWHEAVAVVADRTAMQNTFIEVGGWQLIDEGEVSDGWLKLWGVQDRSATYGLIANPGSERGYIRIVEFSGAPAPYIRSNDQPWDTGGLFDINLRVRDMNGIRDQLMARGWSAPSDPVSFTFGPFEVTEWLPRSPEGVRIAAVERLRPPLEGWPNLKKMSRAFNSTMTVQNMTEARAFWEGVLGFKQYLVHKAPSKQAGPNVLGFPHDMATQVVRDVYILHPDGTNEGSIELLAYEGATGYDFSGRTAMPSRGLSRLRFPVDNMAAFAEMLRTRNITIEAEARNLIMSKSGLVDVVVVRAPGGAIIEFYQKTGQ